jgi:3-oxoacyl-[acyl-carrier-protein] synthase-3
MGTEAAKIALEQANLAPEDIDLIIPHQANQRIIDAAARGLKLPMEKFAVNVDRYGNTSTASIPLAMVEAIETGRVNPGDQVVFVGFGGGLTWGAVAATWTGPIDMEDRKAAWPYRFTSLYSRYIRVRSAVLRFVRYVEGVIWGRHRRQ